MFDSSLSYTLIYTFFCVHSTLVKKNIFKKCVDVAWPSVVI